MNDEPNCCKPNDQDIKMQDPAINKYVASAVLIDEDNKILISKRPSDKELGDYWEFPGGKIEELEAAQIALKRELKEELGITVCTGCLTPLSFTSYRYDGFHLVMLVFSCRNWKGIPSSMENQELKWINKNQLKDFDMPPANNILKTVIRDL